MSKVIRITGDSITYSSGIIPTILIDRGAKLPLHKQVYDGFRSAILRGQLLPGQQVPSSRELALGLGISRFPVLDAYAQLLAEGHFETRIGSGTFVSACLPGKTAKPVERRPLAGPRPVSRRGQLVPSFEPVPWRSGWGSFGVHQPAIDHFPFRLWSKLLAQSGGTPSPRSVHQIDPLGLEKFRETICTYLRTARAVQCEPQQVMIVSGSQQALAITAQVLLDPGDSVWIEDPGSPLTRAVLMNAGGNVIPVPVDGEGLNVTAGSCLFHKARAAFVTPSHQYPLGATMSVARRLQLLSWAHEAGAWIVEDDYDSEYRYGSMPIPSLQSLDSNARVIYIGTFSKVLLPSVRLGYIVVPPDLLDRFVAVCLAFDIFPGSLYQQVVARFIREGHFARHVRRMRSLYKERHRVLIDGIRCIFGGSLEIHGVEAGMHITVTIPPGRCDVELAWRAAKRKLWLWPLSPCYAGEPRNGFILGFGSTPVHHVQVALEGLRQILEGP